MLLTQETTNGSAASGISPLSRFAKNTSVRIAGLSIAALATAFCFSPVALAQDDASGAGAVSLKNHPGWVQIPGQLVRPDCVHQVPKGASIEIGADQSSSDVTLNGVFVAHYDACPEAPIATRPRHGVTPKFSDDPGTGNGWVEAVQWNVPLASGDNIDDINGTWIVPSNPSSTGGLIYLFNGIEPTTQNWILQPVLQWGYNGLFGGNYWVIASWMVSSSGSAFYSPAETVYAGHSIYGVTYITSVSGGKLNWKVFAEDTTSGAYSWITAWSSGLKWNWAYSGVLEAYYITSCAEFPASGYTPFKNTAVYHGFPSYKYDAANWYGAVYSYGGPSCGFSPFPDGSINYLFW